METHLITGPQLVPREAEARAVLRACPVARHRLVAQMRLQSQAASVGGTHVCGPVASGWPRSPLPGLVALWILAEPW